MSIRVKSQINNYRYTDAWWRKYTKYQKWIYLDKETKKAVQQVYEDCEIPSRADAQRNFTILLANLFNVRKRKPIAISMDSNSWKKDRYNEAGQSTIKYVHKLHKKGYIVMKNGYYDKNNPANCYKTKISPTDKLLDLLPILRTGIVAKPTELVRLKKKINGVKTLVDYEDNPNSIRYRKFLEELNHVNSQADIRFDDQKLYFTIFSSFTNDFEHGGRFYAKGYRHYVGRHNRTFQGLEENERAEITIDGESICELDFKGLHPNLLYALEGIQSYLDPYSIVDNRKELRPFLKSVLLYMMNCKNFKDAQFESNKWLHNIPLPDKKTGKLKRKELKAERIQQMEAVKALGITKAKPWMNKLIEAHPKIAHHLCSGDDTGLKLQFIDSQIALDVMKHFVNQGIPILPIHDSFIVQKSHRKELKQVMQDTYRQHTNGFRIRVK